jgi:hypothetical protein
MNDTDGQGDRIDNGTQGSIPDMSLKVLESLELLYRRRWGSDKFS